MVVSKQSKVLTFHVANEPSELCLQARAEFLKYIMLLKPQVVSDLWEKAFPVFKLAVVRCFAAEITNGIEDINGFFAQQRKKYLEDPNSHYLHLLQRKLENATGALPYGAFELLKERPELKQTVDEVMGRFLVAVENAIEVKLIQSKLRTDFGVDPIRTGFRFYADIAERDDGKQLAHVIQVWSETWNLNVDWCREHAVATLREWISHSQLSSVGLYTSEQAIQRAGWNSATHELAYASITSRISAESTVYGMKGPKALKFKWGSYEFEREGFNRLKESKKNYQQKSLAEFELWLADKRRPLLLELLHSDDATTNRKLEPYYEILKRFRRGVDQYVQEIVKETDAPIRKLVKSKRKRSLTDHVRWTVQFHVPSTMTLDEIVKFEDDAVAAAELLRDSSPKGMTWEEIMKEFAACQQNGFDIDQALGLLMERAVIYTEADDPTARVIAALQEEGRTDLFGPYENVDDQQKRTAEISKRIEADYQNTGGAVVVRYYYSAEKKIRQTRDPSVISKAVKDILTLTGLKSRARANRSLAKRTAS